MKFRFYRHLLVVAAALMLAGKIFAAPTNAPIANVTREEVANNYLQIQQQIRESQLALEKNQLAAIEAAKNNSDTLNARIQSLEKSLDEKRGSDAEAARKNQQLTLFMAGTFGVAGLGILLLMVYFQWRAFTQLSNISTQQHAAIAQSSAVHQLAAPGRATVESSSAQLLDVVGRLEKRIHEIESGQKLLPDVAVIKPASTPALLAEGQKHLEANASQKALECFDRYLTENPEKPDGLVHRAAALEKLGRNEDALTSYNRAIAADNSFVIAHLHKGGLLNRLRRYDEALDCYEKALAVQDKKPAAKV